MCVHELECMCVSLRHRERRGGKQGYNEHFVRMTAETTVAPGASRANSAACCPNDNNMRLMKPIRRCNQKGTCQLERE